MLARIFKHAANYEDNLIVIGAAWTIGPVITALTGFYLGTVLCSDHVVDLQQKDIINGCYGGVIGLAVGVLMAIWATIFYPRATKRDGDAS